MGITLFLYLIAHNYPPQNVSAEVRSYSEITARNTVSNQITQHKLHIIATNAAVIDSM